jgi:hypothetical protein
MYLSIRIIISSNIGTNQLEYRYDLINTSNLTNQLVNTITTHLVKGQSSMCIVIMNNINDEILYYYDFDYLEQSPKVPKKWLFNNLVWAISQLKHTDDLQFIHPNLFNQILLHYHS